MTFKPGDVVRLKSGGYTMTVCGFTADRIVCDWHDNTGGGCQGYYVAAQLTIVEKQPVIFCEETLSKDEVEPLKTMWDRYGSKGFAVPDTFVRPDHDPQTGQIFDREMPPAPPSSQEDMGPTKTDGTLRNVATVQLEMKDK